MAEGEATLRQVLEELERYGILLESDARLPSVAGLVAGEPVRGSWWGHPRGQNIYRIAGWLGEHPDVVVSKLVSGKVTYVHGGCGRRCWRWAGRASPGRWRGYPRWRERSWMR